MNGYLTEDPAKTTFRIARLWKRDRSNTREGIMGGMKHRANGIGLLAAMAVSLVSVCAVPGLGQAQSMVDYTNYPLFLNKTVPPSILFVVDLSNAQLPAAYGKYPISAKAGTKTGDTEVKWASNVNLVNSGGDLVSSDDDGGTVNGATVSAPSDWFVPSKNYYGYFDPYRCYVYNNPTFDHGSRKTALTDACGASHWDGNFMNWLAVRKKDAAIQALMGGKANPAPSNDEGWADKLQGEDTVGENGSANTCNTTAKPCWYYVKWVPKNDTVVSGVVTVGGYTGRVPTSLALDTDGDALTPKGKFFGVAKAQLFVNKGAAGSADPFDGSGANAPDTFTLRVSLDTEPNDVAGNGAMTQCDNATASDYRGTTACYERERSMGLFQNLRLDAMRVGVMFADAVGGKGGNITYQFDGTFNSASINNIRNQGIKTNAPLAEATYEALCFFRQSGGPCYSNSPADFAITTGARYDPFWHCVQDPATRDCKTPVTGKSVACCKSFVLMISPGVPISDDNTPSPALPALPQLSVYTSQSPVPADPVTNPWTSTLQDPFDFAASSSRTTRLDDVAYYGRLHDIRSDLASDQNVVFYAVNAFGGAAGAKNLAAAAAYGGFEDRDLDNQLDLRGQPCTFPSGSTLGSGTYATGSNKEWDNDGNCIPDTYYSADGGDELTEQVKKAIADIMKRAASGTAISVLASSSTGEGTIYQAFFYPTTFEGLNEVKWTGYVQGLWVDPYGNLREDRSPSSGPPDGRLVYDDDNIVQTRFDPVSGDVKVDRYRDDNGDGVPNVASYETVALREMQGVWEAGQKLALRDLATAPRNLFTWIDTNHDGIVNSGEQIDFSTANKETLKPYLRAASSTDSQNIINFVNGVQVTGMRDRELTVGVAKKVWRLGDVINSTPTIVGPPRERFDVLYGDSGYGKFLRKWKSRRQTAYVGANDGMMHAFNVGYYHRGDNLNLSAPSGVEHGWYTDNQNGTNVGGGAPTTLGQELWGFIPYAVLPQIKWLTQDDYTHVSFVDLKPKVTDVRIFSEETDCGGGTTPTNPGCIHPDGWGTIMIVGLRYGGSCGSCAAKTTDNYGGPALFIGDFNGDGDTTDVTDKRYFYSGYYVLDITNPETTPTVLTAYSSDKLGLTTSYPTVVRMSPPPPVWKNDHSNAKWYMVVGSGQHGYDGYAADKSRIFAVQLLGAVGAAPAVEVMSVDPTSTKNSFMADPITLDRDLDFRSDTVFVGQTYAAGSGAWRGKYYRLTMGSCDSTCSISGSTAPTKSWGVAGSVVGTRIPTQILANVPFGGSPVSLGPVTTSSSVTLDSASNTWVYFGTGRHLSQADKSDADRQYLVGVKDSVSSQSCTQTTETDCLDENFLDVSSAQICVSCVSGTQVSGVGSTTTFSDLKISIQGGKLSDGSTVTAKDGWVVALWVPSPLPSDKGAERSVVNSTLIGGAIFFPTFIPDSDICASTGSSNLYAMYYLTGTAYTDPILGTDAAGVSKRSMSLGDGLASSVAIQIGAQPTGVAGFYQSSNSVTGKVKPVVESLPWSQYVSWMSQRS